MKDDVARVRNLHVLQRLLAPLVALRVSRARRRKAAQQRRYHLPQPDVLKALPLFARWPTTALLSWTSRGKLEIHEKGTTIAFAGEPRRAADVFWLISGKLVQVPTKAELRLCASDLVHLPRNLPKTGPLILPSHFMEGSAKKSLPPLTAAQEHLADSLSFYHAGQLVDVERLLLGGERGRALRCQSDVVVLRLSLAACLRDLQTLPSAARTATIDAARAHVQRAMAQFCGPPSTPCIMAANPVLAALPPAVLKTICTQLKPFVFLKAETMCEDVFAAEWMYLLVSGHLRFEDANGGFSHLLKSPHTAVGINSFVQCQMPDHFDQKLRVVAATYCEAWGLPVAAVLSACDAAARLQCARAATHQLRARGLGRLPVVNALRACACFAELSESAVVAIARALHLRVYTAGDVITPAGRIPGFGVLVLAGDVRLRRSVERDAPRLPAGQAKYFCEALVKMCVADAVVAHGSAVVLHGSPGLLLEALEVAGVAAEETPVLLRTAQGYVDRLYGSGSSEISRAQYAAAERVRAFKRQEEAADTAARRASPDAIHASAFTDVLQNELLASLEVQLHALHPNDDEAATFAYFRAGEATAGVEKARAASGVEAQPHAQPPQPPQPPRRSTYFSLDAQGNLITCEGEETSPDNTAGATKGQYRQDAQASLLQRMDAPPPQRVQKMSDGASTARERITLPSVPLPAPSLPPLTEREKSKAFSAPPRSRLAAAAAVAATSAALRTPVRAKGLHTQPVRKMASPRISALRAAAARLKDEADGVDCRREPRLYMAHNTPR